MIVVMEHADEDHLKHPCALPFLKPLVARLARAELPRDGTPLTPGSQPVHDIIEHDGILIARPPTLRLRRLGRQQLQLLPRRLGNCTKSLVHGAGAPHTRGQLQHSVRVLRPVLSTGWWRSPARRSRWCARNQQMLRRTLPANGPARLRPTCLSAPTLAPADW
jgi:hypothetical protein